MGRGEPRTDSVKMGEKASVLLRDRQVAARCPSFHPAFVSLGVLPSPFLRSGVRAIILGESQRYLQGYFVSRKIWLRFACNLESGYGPPVTTTAGTIGQTVRFGIGSDLA